MKEKIRVAFEKIYCIDEYDDDSLTLLGAFAMGWAAHKKETARYKEALEKIAFQNGVIKIPCLCWRGLTLSTADGLHASGCVYQIAQKAWKGE